jgi:putative spermidine/putrescine transport system ATP-binding protein
MDRSALTKTIYDPPKDVWRNRRKMVVGQNSSSVNLINLTKKYGSTGAVDDVNLTIDQGEFVALLGPSGSGKTTILMMVAGFIDPTSGDVRMGDRSIIGVPPEDRGIGVVFQNYALFPHLRIEQNVSFPLEMRNAPRREISTKVGKVLELVGLKGLGRRYPHELSGGQQQRVALARALIFEPALLLMDEPLGALDKQLRQQMQHELRGLHHELGATILYVTHDQQEALTLADRVAIMRHGKLIQVDKPQTLYSEPRDQFVAGFMGDCNFLTISDAQRIGNTWHIGILGYVGQVPTSLDVDVSTVSPKLAIRPHQAKVRKHDTEDGLSGRVVDTVFLGETVEYSVGIASGERIIVRQVSDSTEPCFSPDESVRITWSWQAARIL